MSDRAGYVYTINLAGTNLIKIGLTRNVADRMGQLRYQTRNKLYLLALVATDEMREVEWALHHAYHNCRVPQSEWFIYQGDLMRAHWIGGCSVTQYHGGNNGVLDALRSEARPLLAKYGPDGFSKRMEWDVTYERKLAEVVKDRSLPFYSMRDLQICSSATDQELGFNEYGGSLPARPEATP